MKHILKKTLKLSFASIVAVKAGGFIYNNNMFTPQKSYAMFESEDIVAQIVKNEFNDEEIKDMMPETKAKFDFPMKTRDEHLKELQDPKAVYDILIIGGGASGAGVALDAASRGLKCAVIDSFDFSSGTSSRSTKMAHGGVRYFEKMVTLDGDPFENFQLLKETLNERNYFLFAAPFQNQQLDLLIPSNSLIKTVLFYFPGMLLYHLIYLRQLMKTDYMVSVDGPSVLRQATIRKRFEQLKAIHGNYGTLMHETQMMDSRMNWHALLTSSINSYIPGMKGATLANYVEFQDFVKSADGKIEGAVLYDKLKKKQFKVKSKVVVNCAGIHADEVRVKDDADCGNRIIGARGTHIMFKKGLLPRNSGIIIPKTKDGRLIYIINYLDHAMVGTTDDSCPITHHVKPLDEDVEFITGELAQIFGADFDYKSNMLSAWAGIRPLVIETDEERKTAHEAILRDTILQRSVEHFKNFVIWTGKKIHGTKPGETASISRNHVIEVNEKSGLVSLMGGKWTSFRKMGEETVDVIVKLNKGKMEPKYEQGQTLNFMLAGAYSKAFVTSGLNQENEKLFSQYEDEMVFNYEIPRECAKNLIHSYGTMSIKVARLGAQNKANERIHPDYPFLKSEIHFAIKYEMAEKPNDVLCRRMPIGFLNKQIAIDLLPEVVELMAKEKKWNSQRKKEELEEALNMLAYLK